MNDGDFVIVEFFVGYFFKFRYSFGNDFFYVTEKHFGNCFRRVPFCDEGVFLLHHFGKVFQHLSSGRKKEFWKMFFVRIIPSVCTAYLFVNFVCVRSVVYFG